MLNANSMSLMTRMEGDDVCELGLLTLPVNAVVSATTVILLMTSNVTTMLAGWRYRFVTIDNLMSIVHS